VSAPAFTAADLAFDAAAHTYTLPDGRQVPSVTAILKAQGYSEDFDAIAAMSESRRDHLEYRRALGTAIHADAHAFDDGALDESTVHPDVRPYLQAWKVFRENTHMVPLSRERMVFHPLYFYCGTLDGIFRKTNGQTVLVDLKIGDPEAAGADLQTAAYLDAWTFEHPDDRVQERWAVRLVPDRGVPYRIAPYNNWHDFTNFRTLVSAYHTVAGRRRFA
jgi:hypothetical protein